jgi:signal transduction histidine kinase
MPDDARVTAADLRPVDLFDDLGDEALEGFAAAAEWRSYDPGDLVLEQGEEPEGLLCLLDGTIQMLARNGDRFEPMGQQDSPTWIGAIASLTEGPMGVRAVAREPCRIAVVPGPEFRRLALAHPGVHRRVMQQVAPIMSLIASREQNRERLAALGTMAAGLAHELNNPAAAARRSAAELGDALDVIGSALREFVDAGIEREDAARIADLQDEAVARARDRTALDALDASDAEDAMLDRLEEMGVADAWRLAEPLARAGVDDEWLARVRELAGPATPAALGSVAATVNARALVAELREATERMSALVGAVKAYAYMDRGGTVEVDVHEGLETTLAVLGYKLKHTEIKVDRAYDKTLPKLTVRGSELNQVWTNLLDNAIDALGQSGTIRVGTRRDGDCAEIAIGDDGPGIPPAVREHLFDPFFTTKDVGHGTGLGLATARRIVVDRHDGSLSVDSRPGATVFTVRLPLERNGSS